MNEIYLDNNATTRPLPAVVEAVKAALVEGWGNPSSIHGSGERARKVVDAARESLAALVGARPTEVVFTSGATESINTVMRGAVDAARGAKPRLVITSVEHEATIECAAALRAAGVVVDVIRVDAQGRLDLGHAAELLATPAHLCSVMFSNNETGMLLPVHRVGEICKERGVPFHVDATQAAGKAPLDVEHLLCDWLSLSGHKFHAPKGVGILYVRRGSRFRRLLHGAPHEGSRRAGTENVPGIAGMGVAARIVSEGIPERRDHLARLTRRLEARLLEVSRTRLNGTTDGRLPGTVNLSFAGIEGSAIVLTAAREGVCLSAGSACSAAQFGGSHVLEAMGVPFEWLHGAIRISCSAETTLDEVDRACAVIERSVTYLRSLDPRLASPGSVGPA
jgi:cysteine desulfurase